MSRRVAATLILVALLTLSAAASSRGQVPLLVTADLHQKAFHQGVVRVVVQVNAPYVPESHLPARAHVLAQRQSISAAQRLVRASLGGVAHRVVREFRGARPLMAIEVGPDGLRMLESMRGVVTHIVEDVPRTPALAESGPRIQATQAAALGYDGTGSVIVVMDTGVDKTHPFFEDGSGASRIIHEACFSSNSMGATTLCPNGQEQDLSPGSGDICDTSIDGCDHGTHVAGIAAGRGVSFNGVAPGADLVSIQVFSMFNSDQFCGGAAFTPCVGSFPSDELEAATYVHDTLLDSLSMNIAAVNLSLGSQAFSIPCDASFPAESLIITELRTRGVATVAAAGNAGLPSAVTAPACLGSAISVGATTDPPSETIAAFSNRAAGLSLLAPGVTVTTSAPGGGFESVNGTSMATPHVSGIFAIFKQAVPTATVDEVLAALQATGQPIGGFKRVRIIDALATFPSIVPAVQFSSATYSANEGDATTTATITVTRTGPASVIASSSASVLFSTTAGTAIPGTTGAADYVPVASQLISFGPGETSQSVQITLRGDFTVEPNETVGLALSGASGATLGPRATAALTLVNDDVPGTIALDQSTYSVNETAGTATMTLRRTGGLGAGAVAMVSTVTGGSATPGADYAAFTNRTVTFAGGAATATFTVTVVNDPLAEANETVNLRITAVGGGAVIGAPNTAVLTIVSEDVPGSVQFAQPAYAVTEGTASAAITVNRSGGSASGVTIQYRVVPGNPGSANGGSMDYTLATGTLTFGANETARTLSMTIANGTVIESDETVNIELFNPSVGLTIGAPNTTTLTIHDNDAPTFRFGAAKYAVAEGSSVRVTVVRTNGVGSAVTVGYEVQGGGTATGGGQDYTLANGTVSFAVGVTSQTITIPTIQDSRFEGNETIVVKLVNPSIGTLVAPDTTTVTITDNDTPGAIQFSAGAYSVVENAGPGVVRVTRTGANLASGITVQLTTVNGTATAGTDYASSTQVLTFAAGEAFKNIQIPTLNDTLPEGNETVALTVGNPSGGATLGTIKTAVLTILDDEQSLQFSAPVYVVSEAAAAATVTVIRVGPAVGTVTVDYASSGGSASATADYTNVGGTLTFGPGVASKTFTVPIVKDTLFEAAESVAVLLNNPSGALLGPLSTSTITIVDNDPPGSIRFSAGTFSASERGVATITVQRTGGGTAGALTVDYATAAGGTATVGVDYLTASGTLTFNANETSKTFTIPILNDTFDEANETVNLELSNPAGGATLGTPNTAVLTITDDDVPGPITFSASTYTALETAGLAVIKVTRTGAASGVTVDFTTADGSATSPADYTAVSQTLSFAAGETSKTIAIPIVDDGLREGNETVRLILSDPTGGAALGTYGQALLTITDNETGGIVQFRAPAYTVAENVTGNVVNIVITRTGSTTPGQTVLFSAVGGNASAGTDFTPVSNRLVTFTGAQTSVVVPVTIVDNGAIAGSRTVNLTLSSPTGGLSLGVPRAAVLTILEDDATIQFSSASYTAAEGGAATLTVTRTGGTVGTATVGYTTNGGSASGEATPGVDFTSKSGTLLFGPGVTTQTLTVATTNDSLVETPEAFTVILSNPAPAASVSLGAQRAVTVTITDNDTFGSLQFASAAYAVTEGGSATLTVTRTGGKAGTVTVQYATSDLSPAPGAAGSGTDYTAKSGVLTFLNGVISQTITVATKADALLEGAETLTVTLSNPAGGATLGTPGTAAMTIVDDETPRLQFATAAYTVAESAGSVTLTVRRVGPTTTQNTVQYALAGMSATSGGVDFVGTGGTLTFAPGTASRTIVVPIVENTVSESAETFTVTLSSPTGGAILGSPSVATVTITDNDPAGAVQFSQNGFAVIEGRTATITVMRTGAAGPVTVNFATADGTATTPADYTGASGTLTFQAGETTKTFTVATAADALTEGSKSVVLTLSSPTSGLVLGSQSSAALWILDEEQSVQFGSAAYSVVEGGAVLVTVTRSGVPAGTATVNYQIDPGSTAIPATDFTLTPGTGTLSFAPGVVALTITVKTVNDTLVEGPESIILRLSSPSGAGPGAVASTEITVIDNELPDLIVASLTGPVQAGTGSAMTVSATVRNQAGGMAAASSLRIFISPSSSVPGAGTAIGQATVPALAGGASATVTASVAVPAGLAGGDYFLSAVADAPLVVAEEVDANNGLTAPAPVAIVPFL